MLNFVLKKFAIFTRWLLNFMSRHLDWVLVASLVFIACIQYYVRAQSQSYFEIKNTGVLRVLIADEPDSQYLFGKQRDGFEYQLISAFADSLGVELKLIVVPYAELFTLLEHGQGDIAIGGILNTPYINRVSQPSIPWYQAKTTVVYKRGTKIPRKMKDFDESSVLASSRYYQLEQLKKMNLKDDYRSEYELLAAVSVGKERFVLTTNYRAQNAQHYLPNLNRSFILPNKVDVVWALPKKHDPVLLGVLNQFLQTALDKDLPNRLAALHLNYPNRLSVYDIIALHKKVATVLPDFKKHFYQAARKSDFDWTLLAAIAYQESHWSNAARSPTGVRGIMQLTTATANELGIKDRLNIDQTIVGAAQYLEKIHANLPKDIKEPQRTWFAVGAYNVGLKHVKNGYKKAKKLKLNHTQWNTVSQLLPDLYGKRFKQGEQAKMYVERVQIFTDILRFHHRHQIKIGAPAESI